MLRGRLRLARNPTKVTVVAVKGRTTEKPTPTAEWSAAGLAPPSRCPTPPRKVACSVFLQHLSCMCTIALTSLCNFSLYLVPPGRWSSLKEDIVFCFIYIYISDNLQHLAEYLAHKRAWWALDEWMNALCSRCCGPRNAWALPLSCRCSHRPGVNEQSWACSNNALLRDNEVSIHIMFPCQEIVFFCFFLWLF